MKKFNLTPDTVVVKVEARGSRLVAVDAKGNKVNGPSKKWKTVAMDDGAALAEIIGSTGRPWPSRTWAGPCSPRRGRRRGRGTRRGRGGGTR